MYLIRISNISIHQANLHHGNSHNWFFLLNIFICKFGFSFVALHCLLFTKQIMWHGNEYYLDNLAKTVERGGEEAIGNPKVVM